MINCHICENSYNKAERYEDTYECSLCAHVYRVSPQDNYEYHKNQYRGDKRFLRDNNEFNEDGSVNERFHTARKSIVKRRREKISKFLNKDYRVLDIGAGAGTFLREIKDYIKEGECNEVDDNLVRECERLGFYTYCGDILRLSLEKTYDVVFAWHVLEHVEDINAFKQKLFDLTTKYCIVEVPLLKSMDPTVQRVRSLNSPTVENWDGHSHYFSPQSLERLFKDDFNIISLEVGVQDPAVLCIMEKR